MKHNPESFELDQEDIAKAISFWLNTTATYGTKSRTFKVDFKLEQKTHFPKDGPKDGMSDHIVTTIIKATATPNG